MAAQIATLLNQQSRLQGTRTAAAIIQSPAEYVVELVQGRVQAVCAVEKQTFHLTELKHLVVHSAVRGRGLGHRVATQALSLCKTPLVYATVRQDNTASLYLLRKLAFSVCYSYTALDNHTVCLLVRTHHHLAGRQGM